MLVVVVDIGLRRVECRLDVDISVDEHEAHFQQPILIGWCYEGQRYWICAVVLTVVDDIGAAFIFKALLDLANRYAVLLSELVQHPCGDDEVFHGCIVYTVSASLPATLGVTDTIHVY